uniref:SCAN box domain-containing protein n=1 Tax=Steinernema glaseri TaxID=37863 RepID=A0A1I7YHW3_9BILA
MRMFCKLTAGNENKKAAAILIAQFMHVSYEARHSKLCISCDETEEVRALIRMWLYQIGKPFVSEWIQIMLKSEEEQSETKCFKDVECI